MQIITSRRWPRLAGTLLMLASVAGPTLGGSGLFCGGAATPGNPSDLANVVGDQTLEYAAQQPASLVTCARGYLLVKCGDFATANKVFDKCIAAGYVGAMIWKALMLEDGSGVKADLGAAARLMQRAATSGDPAYGPLGKLHYATMLHQGKGVPRDEAAARKWFESAAADGNEEAQDFLRTGYHTGDRDQTTLGAGTPPPGALVHGLTGDNASLPARPDQLPHETEAGPGFAAKKPATSHRQPAARPVITEHAPLPKGNSTLPADLSGQLLTTVKAAVPHSPSAQTLWLSLLLLLTFAAGILRQRAEGPRLASSRSRKWYGRLPPRER